MIFFFNNRININILIPSNNPINNKILNIFRNNLINSPSPKLIKFTLINNLINNIIINININIFIFISNILKFLSNNTFNRSIIKSIKNNNIINSINKSRNVKYPFKLEITLLSVFLIKTNAFLLKTNI